MSPFGWCIDNKHDECIQSHQRFIHGQKKVGRKTVEGIVYLDEWVYCGCNKRGCACYKNRPEETKPKKKRKRKK